MSTSHHSNRPTSSVEKPDPLDLHYVEQFRDLECDLLEQVHGETDVVRQGRQEINGLKQVLGNTRVYQKGMHSPEDLLEAGERVQTEFDDLLMTIASETGGAVLLPGLKKRERILEKMEDDYEGDPNGILDVVRGSIIFDSLEDLYRAVGKVHGMARIVRVKDHLVEPTQSGYRDLKFNLELRDSRGQPFVAELQFHLSKMHDFKEWESSLYKERRKLVAQHESLIRREGDTREIRRLEEKIARLQYESQSVYAQVWTSYQKDDERN